MTTSFITVQVEEHEALPDGCSQRFRATGVGRPVHRVVYESEDGENGTWTVRGATAEGSSTVAMVMPVDDSGAGTSMLVVGGDHGLRLTSTTTGATIAAPYLLLAPSALLD